MFTFSKIFEFNQNKSDNILSKLNVIFADIRGWTSKMRMNETEIQCLNGIKDYNVGGF